MCASSFSDCVCKIPGGDTNGVGEDEVTVTVEAQTKIRKRAMLLNHGGAPRSWPRASFADNLSVQGCGLRTRQTKGSPHAPENPTPTPAVSLRVYIASHRARK